MGKIENKLNASKIIKVGRGYICVSGETLKMQREIKIKQVFKKLKFIEVLLKLKSDLADHMLEKEGSKYD